MVGIMYYDVLLHYDGTRYNINRATTNFGFARSVLSQTQVLMQAKQNQVKNARLLYARTLLLNTQRPTSTLITRCPNSSNVTSEPPAEPTRHSDPTCYLYQ